MFEYENIKEYFKGFVVGSTQTVIGHPFDTIKTKLQTNKKIDVFKLHRGVIFPLLSSSIINSIMFGSYDYFNKNNNNFTSGFFSGLLISPIVTPIDKLKIEFQIKPSIKMKNIQYSKIYKGIHVTCLRESISTGIYFSTYNFFKQSEYIKGDTNILFAGGIAGIFSWLFTYPIDVIKTRIQSGECRHFYDSYKCGNLFKGLQICLLRSFIVNSIGFFIYEKIK